MRQRKNNLVKAVKQVNADLLSRTPGFFHYLRTNSKQQTLSQRCHRTLKNVQRIAYHTSFTSPDTGSRLVYPPCQ